MMSNYKTVLVVDDEERIRMVIEYNLKLDGFCVFQAEDGRKGLKLAREVQPDLILLDWMMPDISGLEVLAELKHGEITKNIPVIMVTSRGAPSDIKRAREVGADDFIVKPFAPRTLGSRICKILDERRETANV